MLKKLLLFTVVFLIFSDVYTQWSSDVYTNTPVCTSIYKQRELRLDSDSDGGAFIVWRDYRTGTTFGNPDIYIQKLDSNGFTEWTLNGAEICVLPSNQSTPALTSDGKGGVIVAWTDRRTGIADIYAQRIDINGNILWNSNGVPVVNKLYKEHSPKIISDDNSGAILVWEDLRVDSTFNIWAQRIDSNGTAVWQNGGISVCLQDANRINHKVQRNGEGGAIIAWQDGRNGPGDYDIWAQQIDGAGNLLWGNLGVSVCTAPGNQTNPKIDPEKTADGVFIGWVDKRNGVDYDIYCNRIDSNGLSLWGVSGKPVVTAINNQSAIDILSNNKTQGVIFSWKDKRSTEFDIYCQKLDLDGDPVWAVDGLPVCTAIGDQKNPNIISDKNGGAIIVWEDERGFDSDIYCQRVSYNGNMVWNFNGEPVCLAVGDQSGPKNIPDNKGGLIVAWEDKRGGVSKDIYAHHLLFADTVTYPSDSIPQDTTVIDTISSVLVLEDVLIEVYPNPFQDKLVLMLENARQYEIECIDVFGRKNAHQVVLMNENEIQVTFNENELTKGIYFLVIQNENAKKIVRVLKE